jgi:hypothetical protein
MMALNLKTLLGAAAMTVMLTALPSIAQTASSAPAAAPAAKQMMNHKKGERHPEIRQAYKALTHAKMDLERANKDFGGHRAKALELTNQALAELREALKADKK